MRPAVHTLSLVLTSVREWTPRKAGHGGWHGQCASSRMNSRLIPLGARLRLSWCVVFSWLPACAPTGTLDAAPDASVVDGALEGSSIDVGTGGGGTVDPDPSAGCGGTAGYPLGTTLGMLAHDGLDRTFRVHVPPGYDASRPSSVVFMFHGGGGSGEQLDTMSSNMTPIADRENFIVVYPDGTGTIRTWNGGECCGAAVRNDVDDVGFVAALLDHLEGSLCVDRARVFASGMSNGGMLSHRLACELSDRLAAIAPVAGANMAPTCSPTRPIAVLAIHGSSDGHVPWEGGEGCGPAGVPFPSVDETIRGWRSRNGCSAASRVTFEEGNGSCATCEGCDEDVTLCTIEGGGHSWPGGEPNAGIIDCPADGEQSTTFFASEAVWRFFVAHPLRR